MAQDVDLFLLLCHGKILVGNGLKTPFLLESASKAYSEGAELEFVANSREQRGQAIDKEEEGLAIHKGARQFITGEERKQFIGEEDSHCQLKPFIRSSLSMIQVSSDLHLGRGLGISLPSPSSRWMQVWSQNWRLTQEGDGSFSILYTWDVCCCL